MRLLWRNGRKPGSLLQSLTGSMHLCTKKGLNKKQFAEALGKRPNEITRWLSGEHNFTISTLAMLSTFFGQPIITVD